MEAEITVLSYEKTIAATATRIVEQDIPFWECNLHNYDNDVYYGNGIDQKAKLAADGVVSFTNGNLKDFYFKNVGAGAGRIVAVLTVPTAWFKRQTE